MLIVAAKLVLRKEFNKFRVISRPAREPREEVRAAVHLHGRVFQCVFQA